MYKVNPYRPGAGLMPTYIAGRENNIQEVSEIFDGLKQNIPSPSIIYSGLRGVGKTVLMNKLQKIAEGKGIFCKHIEVETRNDFISQIASCSKAFLREVSKKEVLKGFVNKAMDAVKTLVVSFDPSGNTFSLSVQEQELYRSNNLTQSLTDVFCTIGETAYEAEKPICFFVDEMQYMKSEELGSLIAALHRANQLGYPVMVVGAGLPKIYKMVSDEKTYSERLFMFREIGSLDYFQSRRAIEEPASKVNVKFTIQASKKIYEVTKGYPFFIQQLCQVSFRNRNEDIVDENEVEESLPEFYQILDTGFFKVRYERCSDNEKKFIFAMVRCGELPCTITNVTKFLGKKGKSVSPTRAQLINKGIIYSVRHKELDFTVPEFDGFIQRLEEYQSWCEN